MEERVSPVVTKDEVTSRPIWLPISELFYIAIFVTFQLVGFAHLFGADGVTGATSLFVLGVVTSWLLADGFSGLVHYLADNFGSPSLPIFGRALIQPFREHHEFPKKILEHGFLERNGNNALFALPIFVWVPFVDPNGSGWIYFASATGLSLGLWLLLTNQIHAWAHADRTSKLVRVFQRLGVFLDPEAHACHHTAPHDSHYCITSGILDRLLSSGPKSK